MKHVRLSLTAHGREAELHPMYDLMANGDQVERAETTHVNFTGDDLGIMHYVEGDREDFEAAIAAMDDVHEYELTDAEAGSFYAYLHCDPGDATAMFQALTQDRLIRVPPMTFRADGSVTVSLIGVADEIQTAVDEIPGIVDVTIEEITGVGRATGAARSLLSDRQRAALDAALELGYYDIPREASNEDVAEAIGCAPSTAAEHLRKAESAVLQAVFAGESNPTAAPRS